MKKTILILLFVFTSLFLVSCSDKKNNNDKYQIVFFTFKGDISLSTLNDVEPNSKISKPIDPVRDGFDFIKWSTNPEGTDEWLFEEYVVTKSMTIFAIWLQGEFVITYDLGGGIFSDGTVVPDSFEVGTTVYFPTPIRVGYNFTGWFDVPSEQVVQGQESIRDTKDLSSSISLYAKWTPKRVRVTFKSEVSGVSLPKPSIQLIDFDSIINFPDYTDVVDGYEFLGWFDGAGKQYINGEKFDRSTDVTITAKFNKK